MGKVRGALGRRLGPNAVGAGHLGLGESVVGVQECRVVGPSRVLVEGPLLEHVVVPVLGASPVVLRTLRGVLARHVGQWQRGESQRAGRADVYGVLPQPRSSVGEPNLEEFKVFRSSLFCHLHFTVCTTTAQTWVLCLKYEVIPCT